MKIPEKIGKKLSRPLGDLEIEIMKVLWQKEEATGKEVWEDVKTTRKAALTTVLTVIERLLKKGLIGKSKFEGPFVYRPLLRKEDFTRDVSGKLLRDYMEISSTSLIASFVDTLAEIDPAGIERLTEFIEKKKKEIE